MTILLVEDDADVARGVTDLLEEHGYQVHCATDGAKAIGMLERGIRPSLILLDLMMPGMHGWAVLDKLASSKDLSRIPVVITTAFEHAARPIRQAVAVLRKPYSRESLLATVEKFANPA
jgi:CheY-like chemotaxis protein